jgi:excisionase family DNA binding protein
MPDVNSRVAQFLSVAEAAAVLNLSVMTLYRLLKRGEFPAVRVGRRFCVPVQAINGLADAAEKTGAVIDTADWRDLFLEPKR